MSVTTPSKQSILRRIPWLRAERLRLYSGITLMLFLSLHFINHSLGLISLEAMEMGREVFVAIWRNPLGVALLTLALIIHTVLVFVKLLTHRKYRSIPPREALQIILGLAIPPLLIVHVVGTGVAHQLRGVEDSYAYVLYSLWVANPSQSLIQTAGAIVAWGHGCLGIHFWLRLKAGYEKFSIYLFSAALILPILGLCGFLVAAKEVNILAKDQGWMQALVDSLNLTQADIVWAQQVNETGYQVMIGLAIVILISRLFWVIHFRSEKMITVTYPNETRVKVTPGSTVLEASQAGDIPHASVCGGRGRCSTCRIRIVSGGDQLPPPSDQELSVLKRVGALDSTRLACQLSIVGDISVIPLLPQKVGAKASHARPDYLQGREKTIAILFADLRAFTRFSETKLPYDVVFVINQYFRHMGEAIEKSGGHLDKFIGDGVMALFGLEDEPEEAAKKALLAAKYMSEALDELNETLKSDTEEPLRLGIGLHLGQVIIGEMGYGKATSVTAIGDPVNTASRLEAMNKEFGSQLIFSDRLARMAGFDGPSKIKEVEVRGRVEPLKIHILGSAQTLP